MEPVAMLVGLGVLGVLAFNAMTGGRRRNEQLAQLASDLGLQKSPDGTLSGELAGVPIRIWSEVEGSSDNNSRFTTIQATPVDVLPGGFAITREGLLTSLMSVVGLGDIQIGDDVLDRELHFKGRDPAGVRAVMQADGVRSRLRAIARAKCTLEMGGTEFKMRVQGDHVVQGRKWAREVAELLAAMAHHGVGQWPAIADHFGMEVNDTRSRMEGVVEGVRVRIALAGGTLDARTVLSVDLLQPLPPDTRVWKRSSDRDPKLGDLILDTGVAVGSTDLPRVKQLLGQDHCRAVTMELVHGLGGEIVDDRIRVEWSGRAGQALAEAIRGAVELAHSLAPLNPGEA